MVRSATPLMLAAAGIVVAVASAPGQAPASKAYLLNVRKMQTFTAMPRIDKPILFDTPEADAIVSALEVFPPDNPWNLIVEDWPLHPNSKNIIESIGANKKLRYNSDMGFVLVPPDQKKIDVKLGSAAAESDKGPYPVPDNTPEGPEEVRHVRRGQRPRMDHLGRARFAHPAAPRRVQ